VAERRLTVSTLREPRPSRYAWNHKPDRVVPFLRLRGKWLEELGFEAGAKVAVTTEPGRLVITPAAACEVAEPAAGEN
jgi:toxic protein SymE